MKWLLGKLNFFIVDAKNNGTATSVDRGHSNNYDYYTQGYYTTSEPYTTTTVEGLIILIFLLDQTKNQSII